MSERTHWDGCWRERTHHECAVARIAELEREIDAVRALMNTYNLGGWTDAVAPMRRALAAEAERDAAIRRAEALREVLVEARQAIAPPSVRFEAGYPLPAHLRMTAERAGLLGRITAAIDAARAEG